MSSWYALAKISQNAPPISTFEDRNRLNARIRHLQKITDTLQYASDLVYQTQRGARGIVQRILADKRLSSFPEIKNVLAEADEAAMDSPRRFAESCLRGADEIAVRIGKLEKERKRYIDNLGKPPKGLF